MNDTQKEKLQALIADWRELARRVRPLESAPLTQEKRERIKEWMFYCNRANELETTMARWEKSRQVAKDRSKSGISPVGQAQHHINTRLALLRSAVYFAIEAMDYWLEFWPGGTRADWQAVHDALQTAWHADGLRALRRMKKRQESPRQARHRVAPAPESPIPPKTASVAPRKKKSVTRGAARKKAGYTFSREDAQKGGLKGGKARAAALTTAQRSAIAKKAALARWKGTSK